MEVIAELPPFQLKNHVRRLLMDETAKMEPGEWLMKTYRFKFDPSLVSCRPEELRVMQTLILREHLQFCSQYPLITSGFSEIATGAGSHLTGCPELPLTEKCDIAKDPEDFQASPWRDVMDVVFSSGTTGTPCRDCLYGGRHGAARL